VQSNEEQGNIVARGALVMHAEGIR
jgi:hypothetical protein